MKILKWLVLGLVLAMAVNAVNFPGPFEGKSSLVIVVGDNAPGEDVIAATDVANAFGPSIAIKNTKLASEIDDISKYNSVLIGSPCYHPIINQLVGYPENCRMSGIKLIRHSNGNIALIITGATSAEIRQNVKAWVSTKEQPPAVSTSDCSKVSLGQVVRVTRGNVYEISLVYIDGNNAKFKINGEVTEPLVLGDSYNLADSSHFIVKGLSANSAEFCIKPAQVQTTPAPETVPETYESCFSQYENKAHEYKTWRQNYPEAERIMMEGRKVCGEKFGRPIPPETPSEMVQTVEYKKCMDQLNVYKQELVDKYTLRNIPIPADVMQDYEQRSNRCLLLAGWTTPETTAVPVPAVESVATTLESPPTPCIGCKRDSMCLQFGIRLIDENGRPVYCDFDGIFKHQKPLGETCQNNYECLSNTCSEKCISVTERIEAVERELKEQRGLIEKILDFFRRLF